MSSVLFSFAVLAQAPVVPARSYIVDAVLFVLLAGGALFAVCRSSRRV